jgi:G3E family GTPase
MTPAKIPLILIAGFLGSGKTTLLNHLLRHGLSDRRPAVVVNDFGPVAVDASLVENGEAGILSLGNGCACCTLATSFVRGLGRLIEGDRHDLVVMETSGISRVQNLRRTLTWPTLVSRVEIARVVAVADASRFPAYRRQIAVVDEQVIHADLVVINRCDLASPDQIQATRETIDDIHPGVPILAAVQGRITSDQLFATEPTEQTDALGDGDESRLNCRLSVFSHLERQELEQLLARLPDSLLRLDGIVKIAGEGFARVERIGARTTIEPWTRAVDAEAINTLSGVATAELHHALELGLEGRLGIRLTIERHPHDPVSHEV